MDGHFEQPTIGLAVMSNVQCRTVFVDHLNRPFATVRHATIVHDHAVQVWSNIRVDASPLVVDLVADVH